MKYAQQLSADRLRGQRQLLLMAVIVFVCLLALGVTGFFDAQRFIEGAPAMKQLGSEMIPPNFERWQHWIMPLRDTLAMSVAGTALTVVLSLPLALLAAPNTTPHPAIGRLLRVVLAACRSVPEIILGIIFVAAVGFGALPGVLALALHSTGMVGKFYAEAIEHVDPKPISGHHALGAAPGSSATRRHHDLSLGISLPRIGGAGHCRRRGYRF